MAKFDLKQGRQEAAKSTTMETGFRRVVITQLAHVGFQRSFNREDPPVDSVGVVFEDGTGCQIAKVLKLSWHAYSTLTKIWGVIDDPDDYRSFLGKQLVVEVEENGPYPKIVGYSHLEDGLSDDAAIVEHSELLFFDIDDEPDLGVLKQLHRTLRQAISCRIRGR